MRIALQPVLERTDRNENSGDSCWGLWEVKLSHVIIPACLMCGGLTPRQKQNMSNNNSDNKQYLALIYLKMLILTNTCSLKFTILAILKYKFSGIMRFTLLCKLRTFHPTEVEFYANRAIALHFYPLPGPGTCRSISMSVNLIG